MSEGPGKIVFLGACLIAAVRLAKEEKWDNSPRVVSRISDSVWLAKRVFEQVSSDYPQISADENQRRRS